MSAPPTSVATPPDGGTGAGSRLRVAVVTESVLPHLNGVTTRVCRLLEHRRLRGHDAVVVCPGPAPAEYAGFPVVAVPALSYRRFPVGLPVRLLLRRVLAAHRPDVVHLASPFVLGAAGLAEARRAGVPVVAVYQTDVARWTGRYGTGPAAATAAATAWRWIRRLHERADLTLAPSTSALADLATHGVPRTALWARGVDAERFTPARRGSAPVQELRRRLSPSGEVVVGYVGRLAPEKRVERLAVLAGLAGVRLAVVGDGPSRDDVERVLRSAGMPPATLLGQLDGDALADAYAALDVFVHTGTEETFGQTLQEAMATGLPVVAPAAGGPLDIVVPGVTGLLYPPDDDAALRHAVATLARSPGLRARYGAIAREFMLPRSWDVLGDELLGHYRAVTDRRALAPAVPAARAS